MYHRVWRFPLAPADNVDQVEDPDSVEDYSDESVHRDRGYECEVDMPQGAEILSVKMSSKGLTVYALVNPEAELETRAFFVCGNGVDLPGNASALGYRGTYKQKGSVTLHVFELSKVPA